MAAQSLDSKMRSELALLWVVSAEPIGDSTTYRLKVLDLRESDELRFYEGTFFGLSGCHRFAFPLVSLSLVHYAAIGFHWHATGLSAELVASPGNYPFLLSNSEAIRLVSASAVSVDPVGLTELDESGLNRPFFRVGGEGWIGVLSFLETPMLYAYSTRAIAFPTDASCALYDVLEEDMRPMRLGIKGLGRRLDGGSE